MVDKTTLKGYFQNGNIPTQSNFSDLIDSMLIQDAGIAKLPSKPLSITAEGDSTEKQTVINFYEFGEATNPSWSLQLNPVDSSDNANKPGFCIADGAGNQRLLINNLTNNNTQNVSAASIYGMVNILDTGTFDTNKDMIAGSLTIGSHSNSYGSGNGNTAGLLLTTAANTEIAVNEHNKRIASLMYYQGNGLNRITIGRDIGHNPTPVTIASDLEVKGKVSGNLVVSGGILDCDPDSPANFSVELTGTATVDSTKSSASCSITVNKVSVLSQNTVRGLNTVILNMDGSLKAQRNDDVYNSTASQSTVWNDWADWINDNDNVKFGDIVAVVSYDAISNVPLGGSAESLLGSIGAGNAFSISHINSSLRVPYALLFIKGRQAIEVASSDEKVNAVINTHFQTLLDPPANWISVIFNSSWANSTINTKPAQFYKDKNGVVRLRGVITGTKSSANGDPAALIFQLPNGYWPATEQYYYPYSLTGNFQLNSIKVEPDGRVLWNSGSHEEVYLDGITFTISPRLY